MYSSIFGSRVLWYCLVSEVAHFGMPNTHALSGLRLRMALVILLSSVAVAPPCGDCNRERTSASEERQREDTEYVKVHSQAPTHHREISHAISTHVLGNAGEGKTQPLKKMCHEPFK